MIFGRTGEQCSVTGKYRCFGNYELQVVLKAGETFPKVPESDNTFWILHRIIEAITGTDNNVDSSIYSN